MLQFITKIFEDGSVIGDEMHSMSAVTLIMAILEHLGDGKGLTTCTGQVGSDSGRVEGMDDGPSHAAAKTGRGKDDGFA